VLFLPSIWAFLEMGPFVHPCQTEIGPYVHPSKGGWDLMSTPVKNSMQPFSMRSFVLHSLKNWKNYKVSFPINTLTWFSKVHKRCSISIFNGVLSICSDRCIIIIIQMPLSYRYILHISGRRFRHIFLPKQ